MEVGSKSQGPGFYPKNRCETSPDLGFSKILLSFARICAILGGERGRKTSGNSNITHRKRPDISPLPFQRPAQQGQAPSRAPRDARGHRPGEETTRINQQIRAPQVRCLLPDGSQFGVVSTREALDKARQLNLDLVEVSANANPPVCRIMDYGKWKYEEERKRKEARKNQSRTQVKEVKFHANTDVGDYQLKIRNIRAFLAEGNKVKLTLMFRGRENAHKELGEEVLRRVCADLADAANVEQSPKVMGRTCSGMLSPKSQKGK